MNKAWFIRLIAMLMLIVFIAITWQWFTTEELLQQWHKLKLKPFWLFFMFTVYLLSFVLKAEAWRRYVDVQVPFRIFFHGILYSLLVNHLLPVKTGDLVRTGVLMKATGKPWDEALHSVVVMRLLDLFVLGIIGGAGLLYFGQQATWLWMGLFIAVVIGALFASKIFGIHRVPFLQKHLTYLNETMISGKGRVILGYIALSWILEGGVIYGIARILELPLNVFLSTWVNSVTIAGQVFHITPGAIGTYESTLSGSLMLLGIGWKEAYFAAVLAHAFKFVFSYLMGIYTMIRMPIRWSEMKLWIKNRKGD